MVNPQSHYRHTKIVATLGPATESREKLAELITAGVDVVRLNMAHGSVQWVAEIVKRIREVSAEVNRAVAIMMDIKGPEIRTGALDEPISLLAGSRLQFHTDADYVHRLASSAYFVTTRICHATCKWVLPFWSTAVFCVLLCSAKTIVRTVRSAYAWRAWFTAPYQFAWRRS